VRRARASVSQSQKVERLNSDDVFRCTRPLLLAAQSPEQHVNSAKPQHAPTPPPMARPRPPSPKSWTAMTPFTQP
jgi:hypothetical protein